jgi:prohibitin 1
LTNEILERQAIEKWDGRLPLIMTKDAPKLLNINDILKLK